MYVCALRHEYEKQFSMDLHNFNTIPYTYSYCHTLYFYILVNELTFLSNIHVVCRRCCFRKKKKRKEKYRK